MPEGWRADKAEDLNLPLEWNIKKICTPIFKQPHLQPQPQMFKKVINISKMKFFLGANFKCKYLSNHKSFSIKINAERQARVYSIYAYKLVKIVRNSAEAARISAKWHSFRCIQVNSPCNQTKLLKPYKYLEPQKISCNQTKIL